MNLKTAAKIILVIIAAWMLSMTCCVRDSFCLPEVDSVEAGSITFDNSVVNTMTINASDKAIVNYKSFSIAANETVNVVLPDSSSQILNRVVENNVSNILGNLFCNGVLFLVNPAGINVGPNANVQSAGLVFSTRDITNSNFLSSNYVFEKTSKEALDYLLLNQGNIKITNAGFGVFVAGAIENSGIITAELGTIAMAAGDLVTLSLAGNQFISIAVDKETASTVYDYQGKPVTDQIKNTGTIQAKNIILKAEALPGLFEKAINLEGFVRADTLDDSNGVVSITTKGAVYANLPEVTNIEVYKPAGDINLKKSTLNDINDLITLEGENINLTYLKTANLTLSAENAINTQEGVIIQANQVKLIAKQFGSLDVPLNINANNTYIQRTGGNIDISESLGIGTSILLRGPPDLSADDSVAEGFGAIIYNKDTNLT
ncbi:MAG: filamentous hemagglutinin N-terminal domain-containing protein, partial [Candidatus Omnitrophica bacterium]|nr:filamentous hemagglutinin N-terminal domain-containing protein [Candidatus Omnitrophota bacterium]